MGQTLKRAYFWGSLQHFGGNLNTRDLKAQGSVEYKKNKVPVKKVAIFFGGHFRPKMYGICDFCDLHFFKSDFCI